MFIVGASAFARADGEAILSLAAKAAGSLGVVKDGWNGFNVLQTAASRVGGLDLGLVPGEGGLDALAMAKANALDVLVNLGADEIDIAPGAFVVYIGTHGDRGAHRADVILPGAAYTEKTGVYVNTEGRPAVRRARGLPAGRRARGLVDPARAVGAARGPAALRFAVAAAGDAGGRPPGPRALRQGRACGPGRRSPQSARGPAPSTRPRSPPPIHDFYLTNPIARASRVMAECSALAHGQARQAAE